MRKWAVFWLSSAVFLLVSILYAVRLWDLTSGRNLYTIDDAYIHMAIAKNFAFHGVYGISKHYFSNASSSPLWTLLLSAFFKLFGKNILAPFVLGTLSGLISILTASWILLREGTSQRVSLLTLLFLLFATSFWGLLFTGLEHLLQIAQVLAITYSSALILAGKENRALKVILVLASLTASVTRPESWVLIGTVFLLLILKRDWRFALFYAFISALPVILMGVWSISNGNGFFPNTYYVKGIGRDTPLINLLLLYSPKMTHISAQVALVIAALLFSLTHREDRGIFTFSLLSLVGFSYILLLAAFTNLPLFLDRGVFVDRFYLVGFNSFLFASALSVGKLALLLALLRFSSVGFHRPENVITFLIFATVVAHFHRGGFGWFYKYEAYLISAVVAFLPVVARGKASRIHALAFIPMLPLLVRGTAILREIEPAVRITYLKNYHLAEFVRQNLNGEGIALDDIGYVAFLSDAKIVDFVGLGTYEVAYLIREGRFNTESMREIVKKYGVKFAALRPPWYHKYGGLPPEWMVVGIWKVEDIYYPGSNYFVWMAVDRASALKLKVSLEDFTRTLPKGVTVETTEPLPLGELTEKGWRF